MRQPEPAPDPLDHFGPATRAWFRTAFAAATPAQAGTWQAVSNGDNVLVVAPTGSGKTLAAFLWSIDRLATATAGPDTGTTRRNGSTVLYISPLKALAADVERNLRRPLAGIRRQADRLGVRPAEITIGMRTGDTTPAERRSMVRTPPNILITTPESLYLLLTSAARSCLTDVETVIVDEVHAVCGNKRGAHLSVCLARLDAMLRRPAQRIGLSATVNPVAEVARFLAGSQPVTVVQPSTPKSIDVAVQVPIADLSEPTGLDRAGQPRRSVWPAIEERVLDLIEAHRSTIVFTNSRRVAERLSARVNELAAERAGGDATGPADGWPAGPIRMPAELMGQAGTAKGAPKVVTSAHHGSMSKQERRVIEQALKAGELPAVVATSSLELGIDMGDVDLVVQLGAPPSVAAGLQRVGRAGHHVGAVSHGVLLPTHRGDLLACAVLAARMRAGALEPLRSLSNPLDVLAQQIVAMVSVEPMRVDDLTALVRRCAPFSALPRSAMHAVLDMLTGKYPSTDFASLRPRLHWDRETDMLTPAKSARHLAIANAGTIPDRGMYGVFISGAAGHGTATGGRVGELDEEMVYESRVGDVFLLGSTAWRIDEITTDRVLVTPAPAAPARLPFWKGEAVGRPIEIGTAIGAMVRELDAMPPETATAHLTAQGLDRTAATNLLGYLAEQRASTGRVPSDRTIVLERFRDEVGDWRLVLHCPLGAGINAPWALAITQRLAERSGIDAKALPSDDGVVIRLPETVDEPPDAQLVLFDPEEIVALVEQNLGASAMFAARFRECAARALLLPRRHPNRRQPLWQQRHRSAQLLGVASRFPQFPIMLEAARECLDDVFDMSGLANLMLRLTTGQADLVEVTTPNPSPFARSMLMAYVGAFLYDQDVPAAERRAAALRLDQNLLAELLGRADLSELLDPAVIEHTERRLRWRDGSRTVDGPDDVESMLRVLGDLSDGELAERGVLPGWLDALCATRRAVRVTVAGQSRWLAITDAGRYRDAMAVELPAGIPAAYLEPVEQPLADLMARYAGTHGPFTTAALLDRYHLDQPTVERALERLAAEGRLVSGTFTSGTVTSDTITSGDTLTTGGPTDDASAATSARQWCDADVLRLLRRRSMAAARAQIEPAGPAALARFTLHWQHVATADLRGVEGVLEAVEQLAGLAMPLPVMERLILPARVADYDPKYLDELCTSGEVTWCGCPDRPAAQGWIVLATQQTAATLLPQPTDPALLGSLHRAILEIFETDQALFFPALYRRLTESETAARLTGPTVARPGEAVTRPAEAVTRPAEVAAAIADLVAAGWLASDTLAPLRASVAGANQPVRPRRVRQRPGRVALGRFRPPGAPLMGTDSPTVAGRWYRTPQRIDDPTHRAAATAEMLLERYGLFGRETVVAEGLPGGFAAVYPVLRAAEERGTIRRGYFIDGLGGSQFAMPHAVDQLRTLTAASDPNGRAGRRPVTGSGRVIVMAASDPANPYGATVAWPEPKLPPTPAAPTRPGSPPTPAAPTKPGGPPTPAAPTKPGGPPTPAADHRPARRPDAAVVLIGEAPVIYIERGGRSMLCFAEDGDMVTGAAAAIAAAVLAGTLDELLVERVNGVAVEATGLAGTLQRAGFRATPRGMRLRATDQHPLSRSRTGNQAMTDHHPTIQSP